MRLASLLGSGLCLGVVGWIGRSQSAADPSYTQVAGWPRLPDSLRLGQVSAVGVDSRGHVFVFRRAGRTFDRAAVDPIPAPTVLELDGTTGALLNAWGANQFLIPHGLTVDGRDHVWITDVGRQQIFEFSHEGQLLRTFGERRVPGADSAHFNEPTDVAVLKDGSFYVSDGYQNSRVAKFSAAGRFLGSFGTKGTGPGEFRVPHGIAVDERGRIFVADRENSRLQAFDANGKFLRQWAGASTLGRVFSVAVARDGNIFVVGKDGPESLLRLDPNGKVLERIPYSNTPTTTLHDVAVAADGAVYAADALAERVVKFVPGGGRDR
jgi:peptidylamidoglycolate lyase